VGRGFNDNSFFAGDIAEVLVYTRALNSSERTTVEQYLGSKYNLAIAGGGGGGGIIALADTVEPRAEFREGSVIISWSADCPACILQRRKSSDDESLWSDMDVPAVLRDGRYQVTISPHGSQQFFRLRLR
jgi:hypothetical protein